jgi:hypothetical protein
MNGKPKPRVSGKDSPVYSARLLELRHQQNEAAMRGDFDRVDEIEREIRDLENKRTDELRNEAK